MASRSIMAPAFSALLLGMVLMATMMSMAHAGAVFDIKKPVFPNATDYQIIFNIPTALPAGTPGSIVRSSTPFNATSLPFALFTLNKCSVLSFHFHPLATEQLYIIKGKVEVGMVLDGDLSFRLVPAEAGQGVVIPQGTVHFVRNTDANDTQFLQVFDHPQGGAVFVGPALLKMPPDVLADAFNGTFPAGVTGNIFKVSKCQWP